MILSPPVHHTLLIVTKISLVELAFFKKIFESLASQTLVPWNGLCLVHYVGMITYLLAQCNWQSWQCTQHNGRGHDCPVVLTCFLQDWVSWLWKNQVGMCVQVQVIYLRVKHCDLKWPTSWAEILRLLTTFIFMVQMFSARSPQVKQLGPLLLGQLDHQITLYIFELPMKSSALHPGFGPVFTPYPLSQCKVMKFY